MPSFIFVAAGGALGAVSRYLISLIPVKTEFPILTLATNLLGAVLIGFFVGTGVRRGWSAEKMLFFKTGVCGGFTTFSTFSLEAFTLLEAGKYGLGGLYILLSVSLCVAGVVFGIFLSRQ